MLPKAVEPNTLPFEFDPHSEDSEPFRILPDAKTVLITFPIYVKGASERLVRLYKLSRKVEEDSAESVIDWENVGFIQLGSTGIWDVSIIKATSSTML